MREIKYVRNSDAVLRDCPGEPPLIFNPETNQVREMNETGLLISKCYDGVKMVPDILKIIRGTYNGIPEVQWDRQVSEFIETLVSKGFIGVEKPLSR